METKLAGPGSEARVTGGYAGGAGQHLDYDTTQEHAAPNTNSDLAFRGVLAAGATAVWRGMIKVDPGAQQTDAFQESRNLLLSPEAHADAIPGLEIEADDVPAGPAASAPRRHSNLRVALTSFIGRDDEVARVSSLLAGSLAIAAVSTATNWRIHAKTVRPQKRTPSNLRTWGLEVCCLKIRLLQLGGGCRGMGCRPARPDKAGT